MLCVLVCSVFLSFSIYNGKDVFVWLPTGYSKFICYEVIQILYPSQATLGIFRLTLNNLLVCQFGKVEMAQHKLSPSRITH